MTPPKPAAQAQVAGREAPRFTSPSAAGGFCANCRQRYTDHYGPVSDGGPLYCSKYDVPSPNPATEAVTLPRGVEVCPDCGRPEGNRELGGCPIFGSYECLRSELSTLRQQLEAERHGVWIAVGERMPEPNQHVLFHYRGLDPSAVGVGPYRAAGGGLLDACPLPTTRGAGPTGR
jgi:hypothetical protein